MKLPVRLLLAAAFAAACGLAAAAPASPALSSRSLGAGDLVNGSWFLNLGPGTRAPLRFFPVSSEDAGRLYLRRLATPSYYLDALDGTDLEVLLWPEAKRRRLAFSGDGTSLVREGEPLRLEYRRGSAPRGGTARYEGDWEVEGSGMTLSIRSCEKAAWTLVMYFPGDPLSAIPMGYYPLRPAGEGLFRSSSVFPDSCVELEYDELSGALAIRPVFKARGLSPELLEPVRAWRGK